MINQKPMVSRYYIATRPQTNEYHSVHKEGCPFMPENEKRIFLGVLNSSKDALNEGLRHFNRTNNCKFCLKDHQHETQEPVFSEIENDGYVPSEKQLSLSQNGGLFYLLN